ncbi:MAG: inorganic pyrophosphatase [Candidatus Binatia bacterium]
MASPDLASILTHLYKAHPWHGVEIGPEAPRIVTAYIEIVPTDTVKYEIDKDSGHLKIDRPQKYSNVSPALYGFVPQTYCGEEVGALCAHRTGRTGVEGDGDPLDICVLTEKAIPRGDLLLRAIPIGGLRMIDRNEADDKIIAVMKDDEVYGGYEDIAQCPSAMIDRLRHYFLTYKDLPGADERRCEIVHTYGRDEAHEVIRRSEADYRKRFGHFDRAALRTTRVGEER